MPSGKTARPNITDNKDGTITVRYAPTEKGLHQMGIKYDGNHIPGESGWAGLAWELTETSFLRGFFQQTFMKCLLHADTLGGPGEAAGWCWGLRRAQAATVLTTNAAPSSVHPREPPAVLRGCHQ